MAQESVCSLLPLKRTTHSAGEASRAAECSEASGKAGHGGLRGTRSIPVTSLIAFSLSCRKEENQSGKVEAHYDTASFLMDSHRPKGQSYVLENILAK